MFALRYNQRMQPWVIQPMQVSDLDEVMVIEKYSFPTPWSRRLYEMDITRNPRSRFYVARLRENRELVGYIGSWLAADECHVGTIATKREYRGIGLARALLAHTATVVHQEGCEYIILEVRVNNLQAVNLYRTLGFEHVGRRPGYYIDTGEDALLYLHRDLPTLAAQAMAPVSEPGGGKRD